jgi:hypothetical protein
MQKEDIPKELQDYINGEMEIRSSLKAEAIDFTLKTARIMPFKDALKILGIGLILLIIASISVFYVSQIIFFEKEISFTINKTLIMIGSKNLAILIIPSIVFIAFELLSIFITASGIKYVFAEGGWYIGTPKEIIIYNNKKIKSIEWSEFSKKTKISGTDKDGNVTLQLKISNTSDKRNYGWSIPFFKPKGKVYIAGIQNNLQIEKTIKKRIDENKDTLLDPSAEIYPEITIDQILTR